MKFEDVEAIVAKLPGVTTGAAWGNRTYVLGDRFFAWQRPFSKADLRRFGDETPPSGDILGVRVENLDAKDALLAMELPGFFTIPHFNGYAAVLIELRRARVKDVRAAILDAYQLLARPPKRAERRKSAKK
jgi:hypothetical protein